ncbi:hypothetical protein [Streptomyces albospinus]|nr:hypothetical protein [Streptomyces albospinus]
MHSTPSQPYGTVVSRIGINERQSPTTDSAIAGSLGHGALVGLRCKAKAQEVEGNRFWFRLRDRDAWVPARYVKGTGHVEWCQGADGGASDKDEADDASDKGADGTSSKGAGDASDKGADGTSSKGADDASDKSADGTSSKGADDASDKSADGTSSKGADDASSKGADGISDKGADGTSSKGADATSGKRTDGTSGKGADATSGKRTDVTSDKRTADQQALDDEWEVTY